MLVLIRLHESGVDLNLTDYDLRSPLHLAAAEGHLNCVKFLVDDCHVTYNALDRWQNTPLMDAYRHKRRAVAKHLLDAQSRQEGVKLPTSHKDIAELMMASINGQLDTLTK